MKRVMTITQSNVMERRLPGARQAVGDWLKLVFPDRGIAHIEKLVLDDETNTMKAVRFKLRDGRPYWDEETEGAAREMVPVDIEMYPAPTFLVDFMTPLPA